MKRNTRPSKKKRMGLYPFILTIPDRLYPFAATIEGKVVRGKASYDQALKTARRRLGPGHFGYKVLAYRQAWHFMDAIVLIIVSTLIAKDLFGSEAALYTLLAVAVLGVTFQEFYLHPRYYGQLWQKSVADWAFWVTPIMFFLYFHLH